jgi:hypothetical protein
MERENNIISKEYSGGAEFDRDDRLQPRDSRPRGVLSLQVEQRP